MAAKPQCSICIFCVRGPVDKSLKRDRFCFRNPPTLVTLSGPNGIQFMSANPVVTPSHWCGEFQGPGNPTSRTPGEQDLDKMVETRPLDSPLVMQ